MIIASSVRSIVVTQNIVGINNARQGREAVLECSRVELAVSKIIVTDLQKDFYEDT